jgi:hypothetical protein
VPRILEWAFLKQQQPDAIACRGVFSPRGLLARLDPQAEQTRAVVTSWRNHCDPAYAKAFDKADLFFQNWPAYLGDDTQQGYWPLAEPPFHTKVDNAFWEELP